MANPYHTVTIPVNPGAQWLLTWPAKDPADDERDYRIDAAEYLKQAGRNVVSVSRVGADASMPVPDYTLDQYGIVFHVQGGTDGTQPLIEAGLLLDNGDTLTVAATLPIRALSLSSLTPLALPVGLIAPGVVGDAGGILIDAAGVVISA